MSQYGTIYRMSWLTAQEDVTVTVSIYDTENLIDDSASPTIYTLTPTGNPCVVSVINNNREKWGIKSKQAKLEFYSVPGINAYNFADSNDSRWLVEIKTDADEMILTGFIVLTDISRPFMPDKSVITLTVSDNLGLLKERPFVIGGSTPTGKLTLAQYLHYALLQTGLNLEMVVHNNIRHYYYGFLDYTNHLYTKAGLDVKTFEKEVGECEDCYSVIDKILDKDCFLFQYKNKWWIVRPDDFDGNDAYLTYFNLSATQYDYETLNNNRNLGRGEDNFFIEASQVVEYERPYKFSKHTYKYENPLELICNINYDRGDFIADLAPFTVDGRDYTAKSFDLDCWDKYSEGVSGDDPNTADIYIRRDYYNDYEDSRYIVIEQSADWNFIMSSAMEVRKNDKFELTFEMAMSSDYPGSGLSRANIAQVRLYGSDGTYWTFAGEGSDSRYAEWKECTSTFKTNQGYFLIEWDAADDQTQLKSIYSGRVNPLPVGGTVKFLIYQHPNFTGGRDSYISGIRLDYDPYINGSYQKFTSQSSKVSRANYSANLEEDVSVSDSPKPVYKGALFYYVNSEDGWILHDQGYFNATPFANGDPPNTDYVHPFEYIRVFSTFNQYRKGIRFFSGNCYGLGQDWPDLLHKWNLTDTDYDSTPRKFMLLSYEQNWKTCKWSANFAEVWHTDGKVFSDTFEFKYLN